MKIMVMDGQGGKMGRQLVEAVKAGHPDAEIIAVGTNSTATANMLRGGADNGATGENAVVVACRSADVIVGPLGIVLADSLFGEVTPVMAAAVARSDAVRVLIPFSRCGTLVAGVRDSPAAQLLGDAMAKIDGLFGGART